MLGRKEWAIGRMNLSITKKKRIFALTVNYELQITNFKKYYFNKKTNYHELSTQ